MNCYACNKEMPPVFTHPNAEPTQVDCGLHVEVSGGYGMFVESIPEGPPAVTICHECAHEACEKLPWLNRLIDPHNSHSHNVHTFVPNNPDHFGWDYDSRSERA